MGDTLRLAVGVMGNAAALLLFSAPILTFCRVIRKKSTEEFSCVPYTIALLNCLLYTWYGLPVISCRWEKFPVVTINGLGILFELSFILIYLWFTSAKGKKKVAITMIPVILVFCITAAISLLSFHDHHHRKIFVGSVALVTSVVMYGSPLVVVLPNLVGIPLGILQLVLYCKYRKRGIKEESHKWDLEIRNEEKSKQLQLVINDSNINDKS
ncbi:bidirectional sugar transporter SWEET3 isoform X2 [Populus alba]|uniref:bidirectional sugar transporter SWEET3 isoform X2 n=1 Tax=Populus alba TaxID=43335 RepID=UPI00158D70A6|nr:bidirectional sugar transporter SWEET3-like isoform X2 [Populus alba]